MNTKLQPAAIEAISSGGLPPRFRAREERRARAMPIRVGSPAQWQTIRPKTEWQTMPDRLGRERFEVATNLYYVNVSILGADGPPVQ